MIKKTLAFLMIFMLVLSFGAVAFASAEASGEASGGASPELAVDAMVIIDGYAIAHDLSAVPVDEIGDEADYIWAVSNGGGITYTDADGILWGIFRAGQAGVFEIVVSCEDSPSPWTVEDQIWVGGSKIVELCVDGGKLTHVLTDELQAGPAFDVEIREVAEEAAEEPSGEASGEASGGASPEPAVDAMIIMDGCAIAHDLSAVTVDEIGDTADYIWAVSNGGGITYTDADGILWGIFRAGQAGVFEIVVSSEDSPSPWTVEEQIWVGGSKIVELCVENGKLTHVLTDELQAGPAFDVEIREVTEEAA